MWRGGSQSDITGSDRNPSARIARASADSGNTGCCPTDAEKVPGFLKIISMSSYRVTTHMSTEGA